MGSKRAQLEKKVAELVQKTKLSKPVVENLLEQYTALGTLERGLEREKVQDALMDNFGILDIFLLDRIYRTINASANSQHLKPDDYVIGMGNFLSDDLEEKMKFSFNVYDLNGDGYLSKEEMYQFLKNSMITKSQDVDQDDGEENIKELTEMVVKMLDMDHDGRVSFTDFKTAVSEDILLLEVLGKCLPDERCRCDYLNMLGNADLENQPTTFTSKKQKKAKKAQSAQQKQH